MVTGEGELGRMVLDGEGVYFGLLHRSAFLSPIQLVFIGNEMRTPLPAILVMLMSIISCLAQVPSLFCQLPRGVVHKSLSYASPRNPIFIAVVSKGSVAPDSGSISANQLYSVAVALLGSVAPDSDLWR